MRGFSFTLTKLRFFPDAMRSRGEKYEIIRTFTAGTRQRIGAVGGRTKGASANPDSGLHR